MNKLAPWERLTPGGEIVAGDAPRVETGSWRTGLRPEVDLTKCVDCLLCWLYCPDSAIDLDDTAFRGFDLQVCKGCELCAEVCPTGAITMVEDDGR